MTHEESRKRREAAIEALVLCYRRDQEEIAKRLVSEVLRWATVQLSQGTSGKRRILDPEDLTQEVVCEVLKSLPRFDSSEGAFMAYAWKIIQRRAHTVLNRASRDTQRRAVDPATGALDALAASTRTVITRLAESEEHRAFERAVASLTEEDRFLVAAKLSSQSQEALSRDMGIEAATLRKQVSRAVGRLKEKLSGSSDLPREGNTA